MKTPNKKSAANKDSEIGASKKTDLKSTDPKPKKRFSDDDDDNFEDLQDFNGFNDYNDYDEEDDY